MNYVYLLKSLKDGKQYIGSTKNLEKRFRLHSGGFVKSTKNRRPLVLAGFQKCQTINDASILEKKYKKSHNALERAINRGEFVVINGE